MASPITLIVARARNRVIGHNNSMPWHIPEELKHFKATTLGGVLLMGRKTYESIGRPLPGRTTLVLTRDPAWNAEGVEPVSSVEAGLQKSGDRPLFIAGGSELYRLALPQVDALLITEIDLAPEGDTFFEDPDPQQWVKTNHEPRSSAQGINFAITRWVRRSA
jgi:dihydrofolate reductase